MADQSLEIVASSDVMETASISHKDIIPDESRPEIRSNLSVFHDGINHCIDKCLDAKIFAACYKPLWDGKKDMFESLIQQVMSNAKDKVKGDLENAFKSEDLERSLGLMDELMKESKITNTEKVAWRPSGDPEADSRAYFMSIKRRKLQELESELQKTKVEEKMLTNTVEGKRKELFALEERIKLALEEESEVLKTTKEFGLENASFIESISGKVDTKLDYDTEPESMET